MRTSALLPAVLARREAERLTFTPRELTAEQHAELAARMACPGIVQTEEEQARTNAALMEDIARAQRASEAREACEVAFMPSAETWGCR